MSLSDRELLELAALAVGHRVLCSASDLCGGHDDGAVILEGVQEPWNPLTDDGDALRLAVKLGIDVHQFPESGPPFVEAFGVPGEYGSEELYDADPYAATRRAIVRAAAAVGSTK